MNLFAVIRNFDNLDHTAIAQWLGENHPDLLLQAVNASRTPQWIIDLPRIYQRGDSNSVYAFAGPHLVAAIKHVRIHTGLGLADAKDVVIWLRDGGSTSNLSDEALAVANEITIAGVVLSTN
jgi:hypothetical protein